MCEHEECYTSAMKTGSYAQFEGAKTEKRAAKDEICIGAAKLRARSSAGRSDCERLSIDAGPPTS